MMDMSKEIKRMMFERDVTISKLAEMLNTTQPNLSNKFKRNDQSEYWSEKIRSDQQLDFLLKSFNPSKDNKLN